MTRKNIIAIILIALVAGVAGYYINMGMENHHHGYDRDHDYKDGKDYRDKKYDDDEDYDEREEMSEDAMGDEDAEMTDAPEVAAEAVIADDVVEDAVSGEVKEFTIDSFSFGYSMEEIRVNQGDTVTINLTSSQGFHDWTVDEFAAATDAINVGQTASVTFVADQTGEFEYYCSVGSHRLNGMVGTLIVE